MTYIGRPISDQCSSTRIRISVQGAVEQPLDAHRSNHSGRGATSHHTRGTYLCVEIHTLKLLSTAEARLFTTVHGVHDYDDA